MKLKPPSAANDPWSPPSLCKCWLTYQEGWIIAQLIYFNSRRYKITAWENFCLRNNYEKSLLNTRHSDPSKFELVWLFLLFNRFQLHLLLLCGFFCEIKFSENFFVDIKDQLQLTLNNCKETFFSKTILNRVRNPLRAIS